MKNVMKMFPIAGFILLFFDLIWLLSIGLLWWEREKLKPPQHKDKQNQYDVPLTPAENILD